MRRAAPVALFIVVVGAALGLAFRPRGDGHEPSPGVLHCYVVSQESAVYVEVRVSDAGRACDGLAQSFGKRGEYWRVELDPPRAYEPPVCTMEKGGTLSVYDTGGRIRGSQICANLRAAGWTDETSPAGHS